MDTTQVRSPDLILKLTILTSPGVPGPSLISPTTNNSARFPTPARSPAPPTVSKPDYSPFSAFGSSHPTSQSTTPQPSLFQQQQAMQAQKYTAASTKQPPPSDPFAALASPTTSTAPAKPKSMFDFASHTPVSAPAQAPAPADDDDWAFSSALPDGLPSSNTILVSETQLSISLHAAREPLTPSVITMSITFSSKSDEPISELTFAAAVTKVYPFYLSSFVFEMKRKTHLTRSETGLHTQTPAPNRASPRAARSRGREAGY